MPKDTSAAAGSPSNKEPFLGTSDTPETSIELQQTQNTEHLTTTTNNEHKSLSSEGPIVSNNDNSVLPSLPSSCIDEQASSPNVSDSDDDDDNLEHNSMSYYQKSQNEFTMEFCFTGKPVRTKLHTACLGAKLEDVKDILRSDPSQAALQCLFQNEIGTPLHCAIASGSLRLVEELCNFYIAAVAHQKSVEDKAKHSNTLERASVNSDHHHGHDKNGKGEQHPTSERKPPLLQLPAGFELRFLESRNTKGQTPLFKAVKHGRPEMVRVLLKAGANPNVCDRDSHPAVCVAAKNDFADTLSVLIEDGNANVELAHSFTNHTPLLQAAKSKSINCLKVLLGRDNVCNKRHQTVMNGWSAVHIAAYFDSVEVLKILLKGGVPPNLVTKDGDTALHIGAFNNSRTVCEELVRHGASKMKENTSEKNPYQVAVERGNTQLYDILKPPFSMSVKKNGCPCVIQ